MDQSRSRVAFSCWTTAVMVIVAVITIQAGITPDSLNSIMANAKRGEAVAQRRLGLIYKDGKDIRKNDTLAVFWFREAAEQGDADAQQWLGVMYYNAWGVAQNDSEAVQWSRKAAEQGNADAQCNLGVMYDKGDGCFTRLR